MKASRRDGWIAAALIALLLVVFHADGGFLPGNDAKPSVYAAATLLAEGRMTFSPDTEPFMFKWEIDGPTGTRSGSLVNWTSPINGVSPRELYASGSLRLKGPKYFLVESHSHAFVSTYGPAPPLVALPVFAFLHAALGDLRDHPRALWYGGKAAAALLMAIAAALLFLTARRLDLDERRSVVVALVYALGTCAWSVLSQTLWQQAADSFFLMLGAFLFVRALATEPGSARGAFAACGLAFGMAGACRPTAFVALAVVSTYVLFARRRDAFSFAAGAAAPVLATLLYNASTFGSPFVFGQLLALGEGGRSVWSFSPEGLAGTLFSPGRGLFVFSPVVGFAVWGIVRAWRQRDDSRWAAIRVFSAAAGAMILVEALPADWWGGWSYAYRRIADPIPLVVLGLVPVASDIARTTARRVSFAVALGWSVFVQVLGATAYDLDGWNARVENGVAQNIDQPRFRARLWSIGDSPIAYYATHWSEARAHRNEWIAIWLRRPSA